MIIDHLNIKGVLSSLVRYHITQEKCAVLKMARSKTSRKLYLRVDNANHLMKISMNSTIKTKKEDRFKNFCRQR